jgi:hypothetical protein
MYEMLVITSMNHSSNLSMRFQPLRIKQSKIGDGIRGDQETAWLNFRAFQLFRNHPHVYMTQNYDILNPTVATTNLAADIHYYEKKYPEQKFLKVCTSSDEQLQHEMFCSKLTNSKYHVSISRKAVRLVRNIQRRTRDRSPQTVIFLRIYEDGHYFAAFYYPFDHNRLELFDAGGSSFDIPKMRKIQYDTFHYLFGIRYNHKRHSNKLKIISKFGYQQSTFDEHCQTWIYLYLYKRFYCGLSIGQWKYFMRNYTATPQQMKKAVKIKSSIGYDGMEMSNPYRKLLKLITQFRDWFLHSQVPEFQ